jgi:chromosome partitioning protein
VRVSEAPSYGQTVLTYDPGSTGALSYLEAARELALRAVAPEHGIPTAVEQAAAEALGAVGQHRHTIGAQAVPMTEQSTMEGNR